MDLGSFLEGKAFVFWIICNFKVLYGIKPRFLGYYQKIIYKHCVKSIQATDKHE